MVAPTGNCLHCGGPVYTDAHFCKDKCRSAYHREREPIGIIGGVRKLKDRVRVIVYVDEKDLAHFLKPEFLVGNRVALLPDKPKEN